MSEPTRQTKNWQERMRQLPRERLLELISEQDKDLSMQIKRIEWVFKNKLTHLNWSDGSPITERPLSKDELVLILDPPFILDDQMTKWGIDEDDQRKIHLASDPVLWAKAFLGIKPRVYQILMMRDPSTRKVFRCGRRVGKTYCLAVLLLHYSYTTNKGRCLVMAPMKSQVGLIYEEITNLMKDTLVEETCVRSVSSPQYEIVLSNGSTIRLFTTGMKSGSRSDVARGQEAHFIVLDEMDYMGVEDLDALYAMLQQTDENQPTKQLVGASTPTGRKERFWEWCFMPGTRISTETGTVAIEDVAVNDSVLDGYGGIDTVSRLYAHDYDGQIVKITTSSGAQLEATEEHPHLIYRDGQRQFVAAAEVTVDDLLVSPTRPAREDIKTLPTLESYVDNSKTPYDGLFERVISGESKELIAKDLDITIRTINHRLRRFKNWGYYGDVRRAKTRQKAYDLLERVKNLDDMFALGLYAAEGHINYNNTMGGRRPCGITWTFALHEMHFAKKCQEMIDSVGLNSRILDRSDVDSTIQVIVDDTALGMLFRDLFGEKENKRIPELLDHTRSDVAKSFLSGLLAGDASSFESLESSWSITLTAENLILDTYHLALKLGMLVSLGRFRSRDGKRDTYSVNFAALRPNVKDLGDGLVGYRIRSVESYRYSGKVYNFETRATHTYVASGFSTHNCTSHHSSFKEFYWPSYVNPHFDKELEKEMRQVYSDSAYRHEIEADWGEDSEGVYPRKYIERSRALDWEYVDYRTNKRAAYVIGVDWDKYGAGPNICVLEIIPPGEDGEFAAHAGKVRVAWREEIPRAEFVLTEAVQRLITLNERFNPKHIYVDRGFGDVQVELLHQYGMDHPESGLRKIVKGVSFAETIEIRDPASRQVIKKRMKPFMVDGFRGLLEEDDFLFPKADEELYMQLISYVVLRTTEAGMPVFRASGSQKDHAHDALILAILAYIQNYSDLLTSTYVTKSVSLRADSLDPYERKDGRTEVVAQQGEKGGGNYSYRKKRRTGVQSRDRITRRKF